jgi:hypothetical protein
VPGGLLDKELTEDDKELTVEAPTRAMAAPPARAPQPAPGPLSMRYPTIEPTRAPPTPLETAAVVFRPMAEAYNEGAPGCNCQLRGRFTPMQASVAN